MAKASSQVSSIGSITWSSQLYWLQPIRLGFAMMEQPTLGSLIERVSLPRFGWPVRRMQRGYDGNTMQYALTLLIHNPNKTNFGFQIVKEEDSEYYRALKAGEFCRMAEEWLLNDGVDIGCRRMKAWLDSLNE